MTALANCSTFHCQGPASVPDNIVVEAARLTGLQGHVLMLTDYEGIFGERGVHLIFADVVLPIGDIFWEKMWTLSQV